MCYDGSWQAAIYANHDIPSNIAKISRAIAKTYITDDGVAAPQIGYYDAGVTTSNWVDGQPAGKPCKISCTAINDGPLTNAEYQGIWILGLKKTYAKLTTSLVMIISLVMRSFYSAFPVEHTPRARLPDS